MFCANCGKKISKSVNFCPNCGYEISLTNSNNRDLDIAKEVDQSLTGIKLRAAPQSKRFTNLFLDLIGIIILSYPFGYLIGIVLSYVGIFQALEMENWNDEALGYLVYYSLYLFYYLFFESFWKKTPAKFITKTRVFTAEGKEPSFGDIFIRTIIRFIPFEAFSYLHKNPIGWHDSWSNTIVVEDGRR